MPPPQSRLIPPDRVFLVAWPLLKAAAVAADVRLLRRGPRAALWLRGLDWALFAAFPRVAPRSDSAAVVSALSAGQLAGTVLPAVRARRSDPVASRLLAPQAAWLAYATTVPLILALRR